MDRDVYAKLLENLSDLKDLITGMSGDVSDLETAVGTNSGNITSLQTLIATKLTAVESTGTVPAEGACAVDAGPFSDIKGWQWLVETASGVWSDVNQYTYFTPSDSKLNLYLVGDSAAYRGKDYKVIIYKLNQPAAGG